MLILEGDADAPHVLATGNSRRRRSIAATPLPALQEELRDMLGRRHADPAARRRAGRAPICPAGSIRPRWSRCSRSACRDTLQTFSIGFDDAGPRRVRAPAYSRRASPDRAQSRAVLARATSREVFPRTIRTPRARCCAPRRRRCSCCRGLVRRSNVKVVLTGEGADEVLGGYDIFKEAKVRQFWAQQPRLDLASGVAQAAVSVPRPHLGAERGLSARNSSASALRNPDDPVFSHLPRWATTAQCKLFWSDDFRAQRHRHRRSSGCAPRCRPKCRAGIRSIAPNTWRRRRCCRATCCPRRAIAC